MQLANLFRVVGQAFFAMVAFAAPPTAALSAPMTLDNLAEFRAAAGSDETFIDFEDQASGSVIDQQFAGMDFDELDKKSPPRVGSLLADGRLSMQFFDIAAGGGGFVVTFDEARRGFGFDVGGLQFPGTVVETFRDAPRTPVTPRGGVAPRRQDVALTGRFDLESLIGTSRDGFLFFGVIDDSLIRRVRVTVADRDFVTFDNFRISGAAATPIPLPAAAWLLLAGLGALAAARRRS